MELAKRLDIIDGIDESGTRATDIAELLGMRVTDVHRWLRHKLRRGLPEA